jgi:tetratricopeptide (TPR) repeat protein
MRALAVLGVLLLCVPVAGADASDDARAAFEHGQALYALHRFGEAAVQFEKAFELKPQPAILYNAAQAHRLAGNKQRALELYESYLRIYPNAQNGAEIRDRVRELKSAIEADQRATTAPPKEAQQLPPGNGEPTTPPPTGTTTPPATTPPATTPSEATPAATSNAVTAEAPPRPVYKKPWFWAVIGGAAVVVAGAVVLGVTLGSPAKDPTPTYGVANGN